MANQNYSVTSNEVKLFKHLKNLETIQKGKASPVMFHISPTNLCNMACSHCCFMGRDKSLNLNWEKLKKAMDDMKKLGIKAIELTGGGEPTLYPHINEFIDYAKKLGFAIGMNTNALDIKRIKDYSAFSWVRISLNILNQDIDYSEFKNNVKFISSKTKATACYIVSQQFETDNLRRVIEFAKEMKLISRIAPDCIQPKEDIRKLIEKIKKALVNMGEDKNPNIFLSDFNVYLGSRPENVCLIHMLKPFLYTDGWVYTCPSSELAMENMKTMQHKFRVCKMEEIYDYYTNKFEVKHFDCSYCKYTQQNNLLNALLIDTEDNEFC